ncbi:hypothetical protein [Pseudomonas juntendi]|uniref:hypothetical protein n=1 Tax=Pseudomonas juntendi TaxID=2666183 RepID=UPI00244848B0|nr:hypothetical protein [Pseudomonas juntendi]MDG9888155.1 hypothetical protein [Pseudomonas juntendi]
MADQTQRLEIATVRAEVGSNILYRFANDAANADKIPTQSGDIQNLKQVLLEIQQDAAEKISISTTIYPTVAAGLAATADQGIFLVQSNDADEIYTVWQNQGGTAVNTGKTALSATAIQTALDASNQAAQAAEQAADNATARTAGFLAPAALAPATRDNGLPLQQGDRYFNTAEQAEYIYTSAGWALNDSLQAIAELQQQISVDPAPSGIPRAGEGATIHPDWIPDEIARKVFVDELQNQADESSKKLGYWIDAQDYGATPGATVDQASFLNAAADAARAQGKGLKISGTYRLYGPDPVNFRGVMLDAKEATFLLYTSDKIGLIIGGSSALGWAPSVSIGQCIRTDGTRGTPAIRMVGSKGMFVEVGRCTHLQLFASTSAPENGSIAYCQFKLGQIDKLSLDNDPAYWSGPSGGGIGSSEQWINENVFWLSRCFEFYCGGSYRHNHNKFYGGTFENEVTINIQSGNKNQFFGIRLEAGPTTIIFGENTANNWIQNTWDGGNDDTPSALASGTITDLGVANVVSDDFSLRRNTTCVAQAMITDPIVNFRVGDLISRQPQLQRVGGAGGNQPMCYSDILPIEANLFFYFLYAGGEPGDTVLYRPQLEFYDKNEMPITAAANWIAGNAITSVSGNTISTSAGQAFSYATVLQAAINAGAAYMRVGIKVSSSQTANALARRLQIFGSYAHGSTYQAAAFRPRQDNIAVTAAPSAGWAPVGYTVYKSDGTAIYVCTFRLKTSTTAAAASGATNISVADATGVAVGMIVGVNMGNRDTHWTTVAAVSGTTVTLTAGLVAASDAGSRVEFGRWATK